MGSQAPDRQRQEVTSTPWGSRLAGQDGDFVLPGEMLGDTVQGPR